jgi:opacity protein-like surface antigen
MKPKKVRQLVGLITLASVTAGSTCAADTGYFSGINVGLNLLNDLSGPAPAPVNTVSLTFDPGFRADVTLGYTFFGNETLTLGAAGETGFIYNSLDRVEGGNGASAAIDGDFFQVPFLGKVVLTLLPGSQWSPFISAGGGGVYSRLNVDTTGAESDETDPAIQGQVGIKYKFNENCLIGASYKCLVVFPQDIDEIVNHSISLMFGYRF